MAHTTSKPARDPNRDDNSRWPVLARIPDLSAEARPAPQRPPRTTAPARPGGRRFDVPRPRAAVGAPPARIADVQLEIGKPDSGKHAAHTPQPPAHHLNRRLARSRPADQREPAESAVLPDWDPFSIPGKRLPDVFAPILSFLMMAALFTVAGTSVLLLRNGHRQAVTDSPRAASQIRQNTAASITPTAIGPLGTSAPRLVPAPNSEPATAAIPTLPAPTVMPTISDNPNDKSVSGMDRAPTAAGPAADNEISTTEYPEPIFPEMSEAKLPQAEAAGASLPVARFSGQILEAETRQAKNEDESIIH